jgi:hypothetical protein
MLVDWMELDGYSLIEPMHRGILQTVPELSKGRDPEGELRVALESHLPGIQRAFGDPASKATVPAEATRPRRHLPDRSAAFV